MSNKHRHDRIITHTHAEKKTLIRASDKENALQICALALELLLIEARGKTPERYACDDIYHLYRRLYVATLPQINRKVSYFIITKSCAGYVIDRIDVSK